VTEDVHAERRERAAAARLRETGADGLVCFPSRNLQYLTGFAEEPGERHLLLVVPAADRSSDTPRRWRPDRRRTDPPRAGPPRAGPLRDAGQGGDHGRCGADVGRRRRPDRRRPGPPRRPRTQRRAAPRRRHDVGDVHAGPPGRRARRGVGTRERGARRPPRAEGRGRVGRDARRRGRRRRDGLGTSAISARTRSG